jgi:hypothetical protein
VTEALKRKQWEVPLKLVTQQPQTKPVGALGPGISGYKKAVESQSNYN